MMSFWGYLNDSFRKMAWVFFGLVCHLFEKLNLVFTAGSLGCVRTAGLVYAKLGGKLKENERRTANGVLQTANEKASQKAKVVFVEPRRLSL